MTEQWPEPAGFGECKTCPYRETGTPSTCFKCARRTIEALSAPRCLCCDLPVDEEDADCGNPLCRRDDRQFAWNFAIAMRSGEIEDALNRYKFQDRWGWGLIFARLLVGFLEEQERTFGNFDLIVASPTYVDPSGADGARTRDHTAFVIREARRLAEAWWPFDDTENPAIVKMRATPRLSRLPSWAARDRVAKGELRNALRVLHPRRTRGKRILVFDDVFTGGHTLNEVARCLKAQGEAAEVCGVSLVRQPFRRRATS